MKPKLPQLTPREAEFLSCLLETFTTRQERKSDERIRSSAWSKLREIARSRSLRQQTSTIRRDQRATARPSSASLRRSRIRAERVQTREDS